MDRVEAAGIEDRAHGWWATVVPGRRATGTARRPATANMRDVTASRTFQRRLGLGQAIVVGVGSMLGAGVFVVWSPAAEAAGGGLLVGLLIAGVVAFCNATSSAQLAALYPESGGTYVYGRRSPRGDLGLRRRVGIRRRQDGLVRGDGADRRQLRLAGSGPTRGRRGCRRHRRRQHRRIDPYGRGHPACWSSSPSPPWPWCWCRMVWWRCRPRAHRSRRWRLRGVLRAGGFCFFAFAGYARIATLGEEVRRPEQVIPRAIVCGVVGRPGALPRRRRHRARHRAGADIAASDAPLRLVVDRRGWSGLRGDQRRCGVASLGVLLNLVPGISRTVLAMSRDRELPAGLAVIDRRRSSPVRAELVVAFVVDGGRSSSSISTVSSGSPA